MCAASLTCARKWNWIRRRSRIRSSSSSSRLDPFSEVVVYLKTTRFVVDLLSNPTLRWRDIGSCSGRFGSGNSWLALTNVFGFVCLAKESLPAHQVSAQVDSCQFVQQQQQQWRPRSSTADEAQFVEKCADIASIVGLSSSSSSSSSGAIEANRISQVNWHPLSTRRLPDDNGR